MENIALAEPGVQFVDLGAVLQAGWVVKLVMLGLLAASVWTWAIIVDKLIAYQPHAHGSSNRFEQVFWSGQSLEELYRTLVGPQDHRHGRDLRRRHARVEEELREGRANRRWRCRRASTRRWTWR